MKIHNGDSNISCIFNMKKKWNYELKNAGAQIMNKNISFD